jgi:hypothetical protein
MALALAVLAPAGSALAQPEGDVRAGSGGGLGVGVHAMLLGAVGPAVVYDTGVFHIEGLLAFASNGETQIDVGGRFWYHVHSSQAADFSLGGGLGVQSIDPEGDVEGTTDIEIDAGVQVRVFLVPNVSLSASAGLGIITGDADFLALTGDLTGDTGLTYFF